LQKVDKTFSEGSGTAPKPRKYSLSDIWPKMPVWLICQKVGQGTLQGAPPNSWEKAPQVIFHYDHFGSRAKKVGFRKVRYLYLFFIYAFHHIGNPLPGGLGSNRKQKTPKFSEKHVSELDRTAQTRSGIQPLTGRFDSTPLSSYSLLGLSLTI